MTEHREGPRRLESISNPTVKEAAKLLKKRSTLKGDAFLAEGMNLIEAAMGSKRTWLDAVFFTPAFAKKQARFFRSVEKLGSTMYECSDDIMKKLSTEETPQGIVGVMSLKPATLNDIVSTGPLVICDAIQDPGNLGTIIRTAHATGSGGIILLPGTCDPLMPKALRASAGSALSMLLIHEKREGLVSRLKNDGYNLYAATVNAEKNIYEAEIAERAAFIFGNEGAGVSKEMLNRPVYSISIPLKGGAESLNVGASVAVILYEHLRQRKYNK